MKTEKIKIKGDSAKQIFLMQFGGSLPILFSLIATITLAFILKENQWLSFLPQTFNIPKMLSRK